MKLIIEKFVDVELSSIKVLSNQIIKVNYYIKLLSN